MSRAVIEQVNVAEAKRRLSDLLVRVAYGGETVLTTRHGRPMARLVPPGEVGEGQGLAVARGWLETGNPFFAAVEAATATRAKHRPRIQRRGRGRAR